MLAGGLRSALSELPSVTLWDLGGVEREPGVEASQCGLVTFSVLDHTIMLRCCPVASHTPTTASVRVQVDGIDAQEITKQLMAHAEITVSVSSPSSTLIDATQRKLPRVVRASVRFDGRTCHHCTKRLGCTAAFKTHTLVVCLSLADF